MGQINIGVSVAQSGIQDIDKLAAGLQKTSKASDQTAASFKTSSKDISQFLQQVKATQSSLSQMAEAYQKGGAGLREFNAGLKASTAQAITDRKAIQDLVTTYKLWGGTFDILISKQYQKIVSSKAEVAVTNSLLGIHQKIISTKAQEIALTDVATAAMNRALGVTQAELALKRAKLGVEIDVAKQAAVNTILQSENTLAVKQQALAYAGIPPIKMAVAKATEILTSTELAYTSAAVQSAAQSAKRAMALELLSAQDKKRAALLSEINALESGYTASLARSLAPLEARLALTQAKNAADIASAKQMTLNSILQSKETFEIKQQALAYAGIPPIKMAVAKASQAEAAAATASASANIKSAAATTQAGRAAAGASGAFTTYGSAVRGAAGAMGMLWFAYGQLLPLMAAFAGVRAAKEAMSLGVAFEYTTKSIQSLSKDVEGAVMPLEKIQQQLLAMEGLRHTPTELAAGMREFAKAGIAPAEALRDLATMSKFATIAEMDLGEAIKDVIGLTLAFQPTMKKATGEMFTFADAANMLAAAALLSITEVDEMSSAFSHAAELGIVAQMRFDEVAAALAIMANAGIRGTKAATALRTGMIKLETAGENVHKMLAKFDRKFDAFDDKGKVKNVVEMFKELNRVTAGLADKERIAVFTELFTARSMKAGAVLSQQVKELDAFILKLRQAAEGVGFIEEKFQDLAHTARAELDYLKIALEKMLLEPVNIEGLSEAISSIRMIVTDISPIFTGFASVIGAIGHDFINLIELSIRFIKQLWDMVDGGISFAEIINLVKTRFTDLVGFISNLNIVDLFREKFYSIDVMFTNLGAEAKIAAVTIQGAFESLGSMLMIIFGNAVNWIIDKIFYIPDAINQMISMIGQATKDMPLLSMFYSPAMSAIGDSLTGAAAAVKAAFKIDLSDENAQLKESGELYSDRITAIQASTDALLAEKAAQHEAAQAVRDLASSYGVLADQQQRLPIMGDPDAEGNLTSKGIGYYFGAGLKDLVQETYETSRWMEEEETKFLDSMLPMRKAQEDYKSGLKMIKSLQEKLKGTADELSSTDVSTMISNLEAKTIGAGKAFKGSAESIETFNAKVKEAFGDTSQAYLSDYQKLQEKISDAYTKMKAGAEKEFGIGTPETAARMKVINAEMESAYENAEKLEKSSLDDFSKSLEEAFGDASTGKLSAFDKMLEKIYDTVTKKEAELKKMGGSESGIAQATRDLEAYKNAALATAEELRKVDLKNNLNEIDEAFGKQSQRNMSEAEKELARINKIYEDQYDSLNKKYPLEQASNATLKDRAMAMGELNAQHEAAIRNSDILIKKSNDLWAGFGLGVRDAIREVKTLGEVGYEIAGELNNAFHDTFVAAIKGDFESIGDLWDSLLDRMLDLFINWIADLLARWAMAAIGNVIAGAFGGGWAGALGGLTGSILGGGSGGNGGLGGGLGSLTTLYSGYQYLTGGSSLLPVEASGVSVGGSVGGGSVGYAGTVVGSAAYEAAAAEIAASYESLQAAEMMYAGYAGESVTPAASTAGAGFSTYLPVIGAVIAVASNLYGWQKRKMAPTEADMFNKEGFRPETFSTLIGEEFQKVFIPFFGETTAKWDESSQALLMLTEADKVKASRQATESGSIAPPLTWVAESMSWNADARAGTSTWELGSLDFAKALALLRDDYGDSGLGTKLAGGQLPETLEEFSAALAKIGSSLDQSTIERIWDWGQATKTSGEMIRDNFEKLGLSGERLATANQLLEAALKSNSGSTIKLEKYLLSLGYTQEEVGEALKDFSSGWVTDVLGAEEKLIEAARQQGLISNEVAIAISRGAIELDEFGRDISLLDFNHAAQGMEILTNQAERLYGTASAVEGALYGASQEFYDFTDTVVTGITRVQHSAEELLRLGVPAEAEVDSATGHAQGGLLRGGSMVRDDLYLGTVNGRSQWAMGGEYIINAKSTKKHLGLLEDLNADKFASGGPIRPVMTLSPSDLYDTTRHPKNADDLQSLLDMLDELGRSMRLLGSSENQKALLELGYKYQDMIKQATELGASETDLAAIRRMQAKEIGQLVAEQRKAQVEFMQGINDEIANFGMTDLEIALRDTSLEMEAQIEEAKKLGLGESDLVKIRELQRLKTEELIEAQRKEQAEFMLNITDQIKMLGMTDTERSLFQLTREMEEMVAQAKELGLGESDLAKIRELYGLKAAEVMNQGLREAITTLGSFKDSLAGFGDSSLKSILAQQKLFDILAQAKSGDFSGVEAIGDVLKDISIDKSKYATAADYARAYWKTVGAVSQLEKLTSDKIAGISPEVPTISSRVAVSINREQEETNTKLADLRESIVAGNVQSIKQTQKMAKLIERWEAIGMPATRVA